MNTGIIGTGARASVYASLCTSSVRGGIRLKALADINEQKMILFAEKYFSKEDMPDLYTDYNMLLNDESIEAVFICTPDTTHREIAVAAMKAGKHILVEKPIATTLEDCLTIYRESLAHDKVFRMGFVLRYTDIYSRIKEIVSGGGLGKIISIEAKEMLGYMHTGSFFRRWHRFAENNGGFLNAKCSHDLDILNWLADSDPITVFAAGSRSYFNKRKDAAEKCADCGEKDSCRYFYRSGELSMYGSVEDVCVFNSEKDIVDHEVVAIEYKNGITAGFTVSMLSADANRTIVIFGAEATLFGDFMNNTIEVRHICPASTVRHDLTNDRSGHGGGDTGIYTSFIDSIRSGRYEQAGDQRAGLMSSAIALAGEISMREKKAVDMRSLLTCIESCGK